MLTQPLCGDTQSRVSGVCGESKHVNG